MVIAFTTPPSVVPVPITEIVYSGHVVVTWGAYGISIIRMALLDTA